MTHLSFDYESPHTPSPNSQRHKLPYSTIHDPFNINTPPTSHTPPFTSNTSPNSNPLPPINNTSPKHTYTLIRQNNKYQNKPQGAMKLMSQHVNGIEDTSKFDGIINITKKLYIDEYCMLETCLI